MDLDLKKQAEALGVKFSRETKSYYSQTCFNNILRIYLKEKNAQMHLRSENLFYY